MGIARELAELGSSYNAGGVSQFRNRIINGAMEIWQRGTSLTTSSNQVYGFADRWMTNLGASTTFSRSTDAPSGFRYSISCAGSTYNGIGQRIESANCYDLAGQRITVSFWAKRTSGSAGISINLSYANSADNFSATTGIVETTVIASPSSSWTRYSYTSSALPANAANGLQVILFNGSAGSDTTLYTGIQLEVGPQATSFDNRSYGHELMLCYRYFFTTNNKLGGVNWSSAFAGWSGFTDDAYQFVCTGFNFPVDMRAVPTMTIFSGSGNGYADGFGRGQYGGGLAGVSSDAVSSYGVNFVNARAGGGSNNFAVGAIMRGGYTANAEL